MPVCWRSGFPLPVQVVQTTIILAATFSIRHHRGYIDRPRLGKITTMLSRTLILLGMAKL